MNDVNFNTGKMNIVYAYSLPDVISHRGDIKIGKTSINVDDYAKASDKDRAVKDAANYRISQQGKEQDIVHELLYYEVCKKNDGNGSTFTDKDVHKVLERSGYHNITHREDKKFGEWFKLSLNVAVNAINAVKDGRTSLDPNEKTAEYRPVEFRKGSQDKAIDKTIRAAKKGKDKFLWDAKMRFGKTLSALQIAKELGYKKTLIITHRPVVSEDWYNDFGKVFYDTNYKFGSTTKGEQLPELLSGGAPFIYFASMQNLRQSKRVLEIFNPGGEYGFKKNDELFETEWDYLIIDEAHEGTTSGLARAVISSIRRKFLLALSGTPFNLMEGNSIELEDLSLSFKEDEIFTWDYVMEQELKEQWDTIYPDEPNPYEKLPRLSIFTYDLNKHIAHSDFVDIVDKAFNFKEFFRTDENGEFIHERYVIKFLDIMTKPAEVYFPFSRNDFRDNLRHTLWMLPGVKEAYALEKLLHKHPIFHSFKIANVAGDGNEEEPEKDARKKVQNAIGKNPLDSYSITLTCGRMTTGVSIPEWTGILMLSNTSSSTIYLQTAFRAQTPYELNGYMKTECFVFDFAPDRTLKIISDAMRVKKSDSTTSEQKASIATFLNFCPIISTDDGDMRLFSTSRLLQAIKKAAIERVTRNGFDDARLYNNELLNLTEADVFDFNGLQSIIGRSQQAKSSNEVVVNDQGFSHEEYERAKKLEKKLKQELSDEDKETLRRLREAQDQKRTMISILRGVSIRMPMLIYGANVSSDEDITMDKFIKLVDDRSWEEFMPQGVTKDEFRKFTKYYDEEVFVGAGRDIRLRALAADKLMPLERILEITEIFKGFKNPDKETVLTPWSVVNMHMSDSLGGNDFNHMIEVEETNKSGVTEKIELPETRENTEFNPIWSSNTTRLLEINSKSGLYPLLAAYNLYTNQLSQIRKTEESVYRELWHKIISESIYVICKTPMAKSITKRTLIGYQDSKVNTLYIEKINEKLRDDKFNLKRHLDATFNGGKDMKFDIVIGNPPYQGVNGQQIYVDFYIQSLHLADYSCLIFPRNWRLPKNGNGLRKINNEKYKHDKQIVKITDYDDAFPGVPGANEVNVVLWKRNFDNGLNGKVSIYKPDGTVDVAELPIESGLHLKPIEINSFASLIKARENHFYNEIVSSNKPYGLRTDVFKNPSKYGITFKETGGIAVLGIRNQTKYIDHGDLIRKGLLSEWKVFIPKAWGNWSKNYLGGAYADLIVAGPNVICTETYNECGPFNSESEAISAAKYLLTQFSRGLLFASKTNQDTSKEKFEYIPQQDYSEKWWGESVASIQHKLFEKYNIPSGVQEFITKGIQAKDDTSIKIVKHSPQQ